MGNLSVSYLVVSMLWNLSYRNAWYRVHSKEKGVSTAVVPSRKCVGKSHDLC